MRERVPLRELVALRRERVRGARDPNGVYVGLEHLDRTSPRIARTEPSSASASLNGTFFRGDILFGKLRPRLRKSALADFDGYCSTDFLVLTPRAETDPRFAAHVLRSEAVFAEAIATSVGTKMPRTSWDALQRLAVFRPCLSEQRGIATALDTAQDTIDETERIVTKLGHVQQGLLHQLLSGHDGWCAQPLEACVRAPITYGIVQAGPHVPGGVPYIRTGDMSGDGLRIEGMQRTSEAIASAYARSSVSTGDLVCSLRASVGTIHVVTPELNGANLTQGTARIAPSSDVDPRFLLWALRSPNVQRQFARFAKGTTFPEITLADLRRLRVPLPPSKSAQTAIARQLDTMNATLRHEKRTLGKLRKLERALSHDLLSGRVRISLPRHRPPSCR